jgi:hypothetical protein
MGNLRNVLLAPLQIALNLLRILETGCHSRPGFPQTSLSSRAQLLNFALLGVELAGSVNLSVSISQFAVRLLETAETPG